LNKCRAARSQSECNAHAARNGRAPRRHIENADGATHFLCTTLPKVATKMALCVLGYNLTRIINIVGVEKLLAAIAG